MTGFLGNPFVGVLMLLLIFSACYHMRLGLQVVIEDYIHGEATKLLALIANQFFTLTIAVACALAVAKLVIG
jgi:succinate dehydrogenase / fumarate reductase membrane anchor subunit